MINRENYRAYDALNASFLKSVLSHSFWHASQPKEPTAAMRMGTAVHEALLEPDVFQANYTRFKGDRRTKAGKEAYQDILDSGSTPMNAKDYGLVLDMARSAREHDVVNNMLNGALVELPLLFSMWGTQCKAQIDLYNPDRRVLVDVKTTADITKAKRQFFDMAYDLQLFWYARALDLNQYDVNGVAVLFIETQAPHTVAYYNITPDVIKCGAVRARQAFDKYQEQRKLPRPDLIHGDLVLPEWLAHTVSGSNPF